MRGWLILLPLLGCVGGGQTGEITMLGSCDDVHGSEALDAIDAASEAMLTRATEPREATLRWESGAQTPLHLEVAPTGGDALRLGENSCERWQIPVTLTLTTGDELLDASFAGHVEVSATLAYGVRASADAGEHGAPGDLLVAEAIGETGQLWLRPADENLDETLLASW